MTVLAALAGIIASQALISGAFSLTGQAVQPGYYIGRELVVCTLRSKLPKWRIHLFRLVMNKAPLSAEYLGVPQRDMLQLGVQIEL